MGTTTERTKPAGTQDSPPRPTAAQINYLDRGYDQPGGKLPLFDEVGRRVDSRVVRACLERGWAEPWFENPLKPDWLVCKLTLAGRHLIAKRREKRETSLS